MIRTKILILQYVHTYVYNLKLRQFPVTRIVSLIEDFCDIRVEITESFCERVLKSQLFYYACM